MDFFLKYYYPKITNDILVELQLKLFGNNNYSNNEKTYAIKIDRHPNVYSDDYSKVFLNSKNFIFDRLKILTQNQWLHYLCDYIDVNIVKKIGKQFILPLPYFAHQDCIDFFCILIGILDKYSFMISNTKNKNLLCDFFEYFDSKKMSLFFHNETMEYYYFIRDFFEKDKEIILRPITTTIFQNDVYSEVDLNKKIASYIEQIKRNNPTYENSCQIIVTINSSAFKNGKLLKRLIVNKHSHYIFKDTMKQQKDTSGNVKVFWFIFLHDDLCLFKFVHLKTHIKLSVSNCNDIIGSDFIKSSTLPIFPKYGYQDILLVLEMKIMDSVLNFKIGKPDSIKKIVVESGDYKQTAFAKTIDIKLQLVYIFFYIFTYFLHNPSCARLLNNTWNSDIFKENITRIFFAVDKTFTINQNYNKWIEEIKNSRLFQKTRPIFSFNEKPVFGCFEHKIMKKKKTFRYNKLRNTVGKLSIHKMENIDYFPQETQFKNQATELYEGLDFEYLDNLIDPFLNI